MCYSVRKQMKFSPKRHRWRKTLAAVGFCVLTLLFLAWSAPGIRAPRAEEGWLTIAAVGDVMMGTTYPEEKLPPRDGGGLFEGMGALLKGHDVVFGNLEGPLIDQGAPRKCEDEEGPGACYEFRTPTRYVGHLARAGFTAMSIANNHALDFGEEGRRSTVAALRAAGIVPVGGRLVATLSIRGKRVALAGFSFSSSVPPPFSVLNVSAAAATVARLKKDHDIVIVSFHGGTEGKEALRLGAGPEFFGREPRGDVTQFAHAAVDAGADLVLGHGPHVVRALELYRGRLIVYSLGNFLAYRAFNISGPSGVSLVLQVRLDLRTGRFVSGRIVPVTLKSGGMPVPDPEGKAITLVKSLTASDFPVSALAMSDDGHLSVPERQLTAKRMTVWQHVVARARQLVVSLGL